MNNISLISFSGGLDSTALLLHLLSKKYNVYTLSFNYGQKHKIELENAKKNINYLKSIGFNIINKTIDLSSCSNILHSSLTNANISVPKGYYEENNMKSTVVPNRNAIFTSILYAYAITIFKETNNNISIGLGVHSGDHAIYPDCREEFYNAIMESFKIGNWDSDQIEIYLPYLKFDKSEIINDALKSCEKLNIDFNEIFKNTTTSYSPNKNGISDGKTGSDIERVLAFHKAGIEDPLPYKYSWEDVLKHAIKIEKGFKQ